MPLLALDECTPSIRGGDAAQLVRDLRGNELDLVLCESEPPEPARQGLTMAVLDRMDLIAILPPQITPAPDWHDIAMVQYRPTSAFRWDVETYLDAAGLRPRIAGESDDPLFLIEASARGGYVTFVPRSVVRDTLISGRVRTIARVDSSHAGVHAIYQDSTTSELARRAVDVLVDHVRTMRED